MVMIKIKEIIHEPPNCPIESKTEQNKNLFPFCPRGPARGDRIPVLIFEFESIQDSNLEGSPPSCGHVPVVAESAKPITPLTLGC